MQRRPNTQTVQWFIEIHASGQLDLNPPYQRRSVWNTSYRRFYIDTILRNYPSPTIYLQVETKPGEPTIYHVIDGKQRLETLISFTKDEFHLGNYFADEGYDNAYYSSLPDKLKEQLSDYVLSVENVSRTSISEIKSAFERLNRNTAKLNSQELRKAQFEGEFISKMSLLAEDPLWATLGVASRARISRMLDVEFVSELYLLTLHGILEGGSVSLDKYYADYDDEIPNQEFADNLFNNIIEFLKSIDLSGTRWTNLGDLYSLWAALRESILEETTLDPSATERNLRDFHIRLQNPDSEIEHQYSDAVRQGTNKISSRQARTRIIREILSRESER